MITVRFSGATCALFFFGCYQGGAGLDGLGRRNPDDAGPAIVWDLEARPLPEIPFPNDVGTVSAPTSPTGRHINVPEGAPTGHERTLRRLINTLDGFGTYAPLWVKFDGRLDIVDLHARQVDDDPSNDGVYLFDVDPASPHFGERVALDVGSGPYDFGKTRFPHSLERNAQYFLNDPRAGAASLIFETVAEEDLDDDGALDPIEDTDDDGVWDRPNLWGEVLDDDYARLDDRGDVLRPLYDPADPSSDFAVQRVRQYLDPITFYELETDTLILQPVVPLRQNTRYAVVLTRDVTGADNASPVRSPFAWVNHLQQTSALRPLLDEGLLALVGRDADDLAFTWSFTTQSITRTVETLRAGLYGEGPFSALAERFAPRVASVFEVEDPATHDNPYVLTSERLVSALSDVIELLGYSPEQAGPLFESYLEFIEYFVFFVVETPALLDEEHTVFEVDPVAGTGHIGEAPVYVVCAIPRASSGAQPPYPVAFYHHGYTSARFETLGFAASLGRFGLATCGMDAYGHGLGVSEDLLDLVEALLAEQGLERLRLAMLQGRHRDLNDDGVKDSGGDFWTANTFHTRDVVRQSMLDQMQVIRVMRGFGTQTMPVDVDADGFDDLAGDFDHDGVADLGGEQSYSVLGASLGGILSGLLGSAEPSIRTSAPISGGGGLVNLGARSTQGGVVQAVYLPVFGPLIAGRPAESDPATTELVFDALDVNREVQLPFAAVPDAALGAPEPLAAGDRLVVTNLDNGEVDEVTLRGATPGRFRSHLPADVGDRIRVELFRPKATAPYRTIETFERAIEAFYGVGHALDEPLVMLQEGFGMRRQTPGLRRLLSIAQMVVDPADPVNYAPLYAHPVPMRPDGARPSNVLVVNTIGDMNVPVDTGIAFNRAAGHFAIERIDPRYDKTLDDVLVDTFTIEGLEDVRRFGIDPCRYDPDRVLFDPDALSEGTDPDQGPNLDRLTPHPACQDAPAPSFCGEACASLPALRVTVEYPWGMSAMRLPYLRRTGIHGIDVPDPSQPFDYSFYQINQIGWFFSTEGRQIVDDPCLADHANGCSFY